MSKLELINDFLGQKDIAIVGCSQDSKKFGTYLLKELKKKGYEMHPIHRQAEEIESLPCYSSIEHLPDKVKSLIVVTPGDQTAKLVRQAKEKGIERIWMQQGAESPEAIAFCKEKDIPYISNECVMMFAEPVGLMHRFHRGIWKLIGKYPKN